MIRFWVSEFDIDGIRLDAADVLDFDFMKALRGTANEVKPDFWLMGEVIHGDYTRWVNEGTLHSVTNYQLHKALYSGHNDHNYFEIAHTVKRLYEMGGNRPDGLKLYNFVDNHDVERIYTKLNNKAHFIPVHILMYTLPGVPSIYYGSEFGIEGKKEKFSDASLRPALNLDDYKNAVNNNVYTKLIAALGRTRQQSKALSYGDYKELKLMNRQYAFSRNYEGQSVLVTVNNDDSDYVMTLPAGNAAEYIGALSGQKVSVAGGNIAVNVKANSGEIWVPLTEDWTQEGPAQDSAGKAGAAERGETEGAAEKPAVEEKGAQAADSEGAANSVGQEGKDEAACGSGCGQTQGVVSADGRVAGEKAAAGEKTAAEGGTGAAEKAAAGEKTAAEGKAVTGEMPGAAEKAAAGTTAAEKAPEKADAACEEAFERGKIAGLQEAILAIMEKNGSVTDQMRRDVKENVYHDSLIAWVKSFR